MKNGMGRRRIAAFCLILIALLAVVFFVKCTADKTEESQLTVGCGDDLAGVLFSTLIENTGNHIVDFSGVDFVGLGDCCGSNAQFALSTGDIDVAFLCPDAAADILSSGEYVDYGAVIYDGNVLVTRPDSPKQPSIIGYMNQRDEQLALLGETYDTDCVELQPMFPSGLPYALENKAVDAIVLDALAALRLRYPVQPLSDGVVTTSLIVKKELTEDERLMELIHQYEIFIDSLSDDDMLGKLLCRYLETDSQEEVLDYWKTMNVQFGSLTTATK
ncbi:MAG: hypothetical protein KBS83_07245 [Lachnospiraceae bacterium]|nr:hypothetical protein [Candidatus Equihabitans merdae]